MIVKENLDRKKKSRQMIWYGGSQIIMSGSITFENILSITVLDTYITSAVVKIGCLCQWGLRINGFFKQLTNLSKVILFVVYVQL